MKNVEKEDKICYNRKEVNKIYHNRQSIRLKNYDYSRNGMYFITICTKNREKILSHVVGADGSVRPSLINPVHHQFIQSQTIQLTEIGKIIQDVWNKIPQIYNHAKLHTYVIMPDHMHGIIELCDNFVVNDKGDGRCKKGRTGLSAPT